MCGSNNFITGQLPNVKFVHSQNPIDFSQQTALNSINLYMCRHSLQKNQPRVTQQRPHRVQNQHNKQDTERRINVILKHPVSLPENDRRDNNNNGTKRVGKYMKENTAHIHLSGRRRWRV